jgi:hypothetical protein
MQVYEFYEPKSDVHEPSTPSTEKIIVASRYTTPPIFEEISPSGCEVLLNKRKELEFIQPMVKQSPMIETIWDFANESESCEPLINTMSATAGPPTNPFPTELETTNMRVAGSDLFEVPGHRGIKKSPMSFPPFIPRRQSECSEKSVKHSRSAMNVSFQTTVKAPDAGLKIQAVDQKRRVFSTRSLRFVASKVCEASPILRRRRRRCNSTVDEHKCMIPQPTSNITNKRGKLSLCCKYLPK